MFSGESALKNRLEKIALFDFASIDAEKKVPSSDTTTTKHGKKNVCYAVCADRATAFQPLNRHGNGNDTTTGDDAKQTARLLHNVTLADNG